LRRKFYRKEKGRGGTVLLKTQEVRAMIARGVALLICVNIANEICRRAVRKAVMEELGINSLEIGSGENPRRVVVKAVMPKAHSSPRVEKLSFVLVRR